MNYIKVIYILLGAAVLIAFPLIYLLLLPRGQTTPSPSQWLLFCGLALPVLLTAILPMIFHRVRKARGLPTEHVSASDLRFCLILLAVLCPLAFFAVLAFGPLGSIVIGFVPFAFAFRAPRRSQPTPNDHNA